MKRNKFNLGILFYNNKVVMLFSVILAFIFWIRLSTSATETTKKMITDIPININLSENAKESGLTIFGVNNIKAEVAVTGNRLVLGQLTNNDIQVTARQSANMINTTGNYTLELVARKNSILTDYEFSSDVSPAFITVLADRVKSSPFDIQADIKYTANPDYYVSPVALSEAAVTISGPESIVSKIAKVNVESEIKGTLSSTTTIHKLPLNVYDADGNKLNTTYLDFSTNYVDATISVFSRKIIPISPKFSSKPEGLNFSSAQIQVNPSHIEIAAPDEILNETNEIILDPIDFSTISTSNNQFNIPLKIPTGCINLNNVYSATLKINMSGFTSKIVSADNILFTNLSKDMVATSITKSLNVQVIGPYLQMRNISSSDINVVADMSGKENFTGYTEVPATIKFDSSAKSCWAYGSYSINVNTSKK